MAKKRTSSKPRSAKMPSSPPSEKNLKSKQGSGTVPEDTDYDSVLTSLTQAIHASRHRALASVNRELVCLYWHIGRTIVEQQETAKWGDAVVTKLAEDLRLAFPEMKGFSRDNVFRMRQFSLMCRELADWVQQQFPADPILALGPQETTGVEKVGAAPRQLLEADRTRGKAFKPLQRVSADDHSTGKGGALTRQSQTSQTTGLSEPISHLVFGLSWTHHYILMGAVDAPAERYFYMQMSVRERWSVRELRRQIDADLFTRYVSVKSDPEKCLPDDAESGDLLPFKDHYVLEFLRLENKHSEKELRKAILANLRNFFLEFGKDLTFVGEEYPLTVGADTFHIDLLFFHRRLQCLIAVDLKKGRFKPEYAGKSCFYCAALDEQIRLPHENPSIGLVLCRTANTAQVQLALTAAAKRIGVATYQTALPDETQLRRRLEQFPELPEDDE